MRILIFISNIHQAKFTGQQKIAFGLAEHLNRKGFDVHILTNNPEIKSIKREFYENKFECFVIPGEASSLTFLRNLHHIIKYVKKLRPDIFHGHGIASAPLTTLLGKTLGISTVQTIFDINNINISHSPIISTALRSTDRIICTSKYAREILFKSGIPIDKLNVVYYGIDDFWLNRTEYVKGSVKNILFFGDAKSDRGLGDFLAAIPEIISKYSDTIKFTLAIRYYDEPFREKIKKLSETYPIELVGRIDNIFEVVSASDIVVIPYHITTIQPPLTLIESMACGKAVITTSVDANYEFVGDNERALIVTPGDTEGLISTILMLSSDHEFRNKISKNAENFVKKEYGWNNVINKIMEIYSLTN